MKSKKPTTILEFFEKKLEKTRLGTKAKKKLLAAIDLAINVAGVLILVVIIRTFIMTPFEVSGISMCNTFNYHNGNCSETKRDYLIINKSAYLNIFGYKIGSPKRGDIVVFKPPQYQYEFYIKRIIGLPGETVKLIDGYVYVYNQKHPLGVKLEEPYLNENNQGNTMATGGISEFTVPEGHYLVFGDNRAKSSDSRLCFKESTGASGCENPANTPYLPENLIEGKAGIQFWPYIRLIEDTNYPELE